MDDPNFEEFWRVLPAAVGFRKRPGVVDAFCTKYRKEVSSVLVQLARLGVIGQATVLHPDPPETCDLCAAMLAENDWFVDGATALEGWANMCPRCFWDEGDAIRFGAGQFYHKSEQHGWRLVAGGDPSVAENNE